MVRIEQVSTFKTEGFLSRAVDRVFGYDFFISYSHRDGLAYPRHLGERLSQAGFRVFLDQTEYVAGLDLKRETRRQVEKSRKIVVVGRPFALSSDWVRREVEVALSGGKIPVVIDVNGAVEKAAPTSDLAKLICERHWLRLLEQIGHLDAQPSDHAVGELIRGFAHTKQQTKRQRALAGFAALLFGAAALATWQAFEATRQRDRTEAALAEIIESSNTLLFDVIEKIQSGRESPQSTVFHLLERARQPLDALVGESYAHPKIALTRGLALVKLAKHLMLIGEAGRAAQAASSAEQQLRLIRGRLGDTNQQRWRLAMLEAHAQQGHSRIALEDISGAVVSFGKSLDLARDLIDEELGSNDWRYELGVSHRNYGSSLMMLAASPTDKRLTLAESHYKSATSILSDLVQANRASTEFGLSYALTLGKLGSLALKRGDTKRSREHYKASIDELTRLHNADPTDLQVERDLAATYQEMAAVLLKEGDLAEALAWAEKDVAISRAHLALSSMNLARRDDLASSLVSLARILELSGDANRALDVLVENLDVAKQGRRQINTLKWRRAEAAANELLGLFHERRGQIDEALAYYLPAIDQREQFNGDLDAVSPKHQKWLIELAEAYRRAATALSRAKRDEDALRYALDYVMTLRGSAGHLERTKLPKALALLAWYCVLARDPLRGVQAGGEAMDLIMSNDSNGAISHFTAKTVATIRANFAHALMFSGRIAEAKSIYLRLPNDPKKKAAWKKLVFDDFNTFGERALSSSLIQEIQQALAE